MTDPFSVAVGVVGVASLSLQLLGGCIRGFIILSTARNLEKDAAATICMLNLQEIQLTEWSRRAGLLTGDGKLDHRINAQAVEETLLQLRNLLTNTEKMRKRYGLILESMPAKAPQEQVMENSFAINTGVSNATRDLILTRSKVAESYGALHRFWWATVDKGKIEKLVADIHFLVRQLWHLLDPWRQDDIITSTQSIAASMISLNERFDQLTLLNNALVGFQFHGFDDGALQGIAGLATSARIKAYRVGLEQVFDRTLTEREPNLPTRQAFLGGLETLATLKLSKFKAINKSETMGKSVYDGQVVFVEEKLISQSIQQKGLARAQILAALLNISKTREFGSLHCRGIIEDRDKLKFVFDHPFPESVEPQPRSLLDLFHHRDGIRPPSLTERLRLARKVTQLVQNFHRAGWLHKSLRSENILFFSSNGEAFTEKSLLEPVLAGFAFSRQDSPTEISEQPSADPKIDIYRHPAALGEPSTSFTTEMDVYSLGTVLLEIAEWRALRHLVESVVDVNAENVSLNKLAGVRSFLINGKGKGGTSRLQERVGEIYASACLICFSGKIANVQEAQSNVSGTRLSLLDTVLERLDVCRI